MSELIVGTYNMSVKAVKNKPDVVLKNLEQLLKNCHIVGLQEAGQAQHILTDKNMAKIGAKIYFGNTPSSRSTPIIYRADLRVTAKHCLPLTKRTRVGPRGAGPSVLKSKDLNVISFFFGGRVINVGNIHTSPSIFIKIRFVLNSRQVKQSKKHLMKLSGVKILVGDLNQLPDTKLLNWFRNKNRKFKSSQLLVNVLGTNGKRGIDDVLFIDAPERIKWVRSYLFNGSSDHKGFISVFNIIKS